MQRVAIGVLGGDASLACQQCRALIRNAIPGDWLVGTGHETLGCGDADALKFQQDEPAPSRTRRRDATARSRPRKRASARQSENSRRIRPVAGNQAQCQARSSASAKGNRCPPTCARDAAGGLTTTAETDMRSLPESVRGHGTKSAAYAPLTESERLDLPSSHVPITPRGPSRTRSDKLPRVRSVARHPGVRPGRIDVPDAHRRAERIEFDSILVPSRQPEPAGEHDLVHRVAVVAEDGSGVDRAEVVDDRIHVGAAD